MVLITTLSDVRASTIASYYVSMGYHVEIVAEDDKFQVQATLHTCYLAA